MTRALLRRTIPALALVGATLCAPAWAFRCGNYLIVEGDTRDAVRAKCGLPSDLQQRTELRPAVVWIHGRPVRVGPDDYDSRVEVWTYNLGPNRLMRRLRFQDGVVVAIETLGYGYYDSAPLRSNP